MNINPNPKRGPAPKFSLNTEGQPLKQQGRQGRLIRTFTDTDSSCLDDLISVMMATVEDGLMQSGFEPGKDYTKKDLLDAAMPFVKALWHKQGNIKFTVGWPNA